jgi:L-fuconate dehydratase
LVTILDLDVLDLRFPTSRTLAGSDAVHVDPDYSAAYVVLRTDAGLEGHGLTFTIGRGTEVVVAAIEAFRHLVVGQRLDAITADFAGFWHRLAGDSQLRWLGPEKGVIHLALAAIVNAVWDLYAKSERKPVWKLLADMTPAELVSCIDFHYITDAITPEEAIAILERHAAAKAEREADLLRSGYPAYTTSVGWMGYADAKIRALCRDAIDEGFTHFKVKVGGAPDDDARRLAVVRDAIGQDRKLMIDANQKWDVADAIAGGSRSRRAPTTSSVMPRSRKRYARPVSASRPASTARTASRSSSCCRRTRSTSVRSTAAGLAASTRTSP